ncbi:MAG: outer membrane protein [Phycisphaerae bacterium]|jgi:outer membrane protein TolC|nr:MAG: outer membrane protein [Phycisphaerae bacterium]
MKSRGLISLFLISFCGCAVDQQKEIEIYQKEIRLTDGQVDYVSGSPLTLRQAILLTSQNDEVLAQRGESYLRAVIARKRTQAEFLPTVDLVPVYSRREKVASQTGSSSQDQSLDVTVQGSINLFNGFQDVNRVWRDEYVAKQRRNELLHQQEALMLDTAEVFFQVLRSEASVRVLESSLQLQDERFRDAQGRVDVGLASPLVASQTHAQVAATRTTLIRAQEDVRQSRSRLALLTSQPVQQAPLTDDYDPPDLPDLQELLDQAAKMRQDLRAAEQAVQAARHDVEVAFGQYYPSISLNLDVFLYRESVPDTRTWEGLLTANFPIFSAGRIEQDIRTAWSNYRSALLARSYLERSVRSEVEQSYQAVQASIQRLGQLRVQVDAAQQALRQAEESYKAGLATNLDRITAQDTLLQAQLQLVSEQYDYKLLYLTLLQHVGDLREYVVSWKPLQQRD